MYLISFLHANILTVSDRWLEYVRAPDVTTCLWYPSVICPDCQISNPAVLCVLSSFHWPVSLLLLLIPLRFKGDGWRILSKERCTYSSMVHVLKVLTDFLQAKNPSMNLYRPLICFLWLVLKLGRFKGF